MHQIFCVILATQLLGLEAITCNSWEYKIKEDCCPRCGIGYRVSKHCTVDSGTSCLPCTEGTYTDHPNGLTECLRCHSCDPGAHLRIKEPCTYIKNTMCLCSPGYFCIHANEEGCELCQKHAVSPPGFMVTQPGTETSDIEFMSCPPKTFSATENAPSCQPWTNCSEKDLREKWAANKTSDAVCEPHSQSHKTAVAVCVAMAILLMCVIAGIFAYRRIRRKKKDGAGKPRETNGQYNAVQETETNLMKPMQETAQNLGEPTYTRT